MGKNIESPSAELAAARPEKIRAERVEAQSAQVRHCSFADRASLAYRISTAAIGLILIGVSLLPWTVLRVRTSMQMGREAFEIDSDTIVVTIRNLPHYLSFLGWPAFHHYALLGVIFFPLIGGVALIASAYVTGRVARNIIRAAIGFIGLALIAISAWKFLAWWPAAIILLFALIAFVIESHLARGIAGKKFGWPNIICGATLALAAIGGFIYLARVSADLDFLLESELKLAYTTIIALFIAGAAATFLERLRGVTGRILSIAAGLAPTALLIIVSMAALIRLVDYAEQYPQDILDIGLLGMSAWLIGLRLLQFIFVWSWSAGGGAAGLTSALRRENATTSD